MRGNLGAQKTFNIFVKGLGLKLGVLKVGRKVRLSLSPLLALSY